MIVSTDPAQMKAHVGSFHFILDPIAADHDINAYINMLTLDGNLTLVGAPETPLKVSAFALLFGRRSLSGSLIGGIAGLIVVGRMADPSDAAAKAAELAPKLIPGLVVFAGVLVAGAVGVLLALAALRRVSAGVTPLIRALSGNNLSERIPVAAGGDELASLTRLLNLYVAATQNLHKVSAAFLGTLSPKVPYVIGVAGSVAVHALSQLVELDPVRRARDHDLEARALKLLFTQ